MLKKIIIGVIITACSSLMYGVTISDLKAEKITEESAKITLKTDTNSFAYINGLKIDEVGTKEHYYYVPNLESGKEYKVKVEVKGEDGTTATDEIVFATKISGLDYSKPPEWLPNQVFYEVFVRAFADADGNGIGDFKGVTEKLDYLQELGVTALWLMPINATPSYHGYDTINYYQINKDYGSMDDFKALLDNCHKRGMKVIIDLVLNHTGIDIKWFRSAKKGIDKPYRDWFVWSKDNPEGAGWYPNGADGYYYYALFWDQMPDLNYRNPLVVSEAKNIADFWLELGVDGFRLDAAKHIDDDNEITHSFWMDWRKSVKNKNPESIIVAENWSPASEVAPFFKEFDMSFDFELGGIILSTCTKRANQGLVGTMKYNYEQFGKYNKNFVDAPFLTNHDMKRTATTMIIKNTKLQRQKQAAVMLFTMGGAPFVYYGEEIGQEGNKPDENLREPFDWNADMTGKYMTRWWFPKYNKPNDGVSVEEQKGKDGSLFEHYKKMIALRKKYQSFRSYEIEEVETGEERIFAYTKESGKEKVAILLNFNKESAEINLERILKTTSVTDIYNEKEFTDKVSIDAEGFLILKLK